MIRAVLFALVLLLPIGARAQVTALTCADPVLGPVSNPGGTVATCTNITLPYYACQRLPQPPGSATAAKCGQVTTDWNAQPTVANAITAAAAALAAKQATDAAALNAATPP